MKNEPSKAEGWNAMWGPLAAQWTDEQRKEWLANAEPGDLKPWAAGSTEWPFVIESDATPAAPAQPREAQAQAADLPNDIPGVRAGGIMIPPLRAQARETAEPAILTDEQIRSLPDMTQRVHDLLHRSGFRRDEDYFERKIGEETELLHIDTIRDIVRCAVGAAPAAEKPPVPVAQDKGVHDHMMTVACQVLQRGGHNSTKQLLRAVCKAIAADKNLRAKLAQPAEKPPIEHIIEWIRNNYQDHTVDSLCEELRAQWFERRFEPASELELRGMWERADFTGGATDADAPITPRRLWRLAATYAASVAPALLRNAHKAVAEEPGFMAIPVPITEEALALRNAIETVCAAAVLTGPAMFVEIDTSGALRYAPPGFGGRREVGRYVCFPVGGAA